MIQSAQRVKLKYSEARRTSLHFCNTSWLFQDLVLQPSITKTLPHKLNTACNSTTVPQSEQSKHCLLVKRYLVLRGGEEHVQYILEKEHVPCQNLASLPVKCLNTSMTQCQNVWQITTLRFPLGKQTNKTKNEHTNKKPTNKPQLFSSWTAFVVCSFAQTLLWKLRKQQSGNS